MKGRIGYGAEWHCRFDALFNHHSTARDREDDDDDDVDDAGAELRERTFCTPPGRDCQSIVSRRGGKREGTFAIESTWKY